MKPWAWLLIFFLTVGASVYLWKKSPPSNSSSVPAEDSGRNSPLVAPTMKEPGPARLPSPRAVQPEARFNNSPTNNEAPRPGPQEPAGDFNSAPGTQPPGFYPPAGAPDNEMGYPGYVPPPGSPSPEEGENGFVPPPFEPPPPLDEEFIPPPPTDTDSEL